MALAGRIRDAEKERRKGGWGVGFGKTNARIFVLCLVSQIKIKKKLLEPWIKKNQNPTLSNSLNRSLRRSIRLLLEERKSRERRKRRKGRRLVAVKRKEMVDFL